MGNVNYTDGYGSNVVTIDGPVMTGNFHFIQGMDLETSPFDEPPDHLCQTTVDIPIEKGEGATLITCYSLLNIEYLE